MGFVKAGVSCTHTYVLPEYPQPKSLASRARVQQDAGSLLVGHKVELGYLEQTAVSGSDRTVWQEARSRMTQINAAEAAIESAAEAMTQGPHL